MVIRNDSSGQGHYRASRSGKVGAHEGVDYVCIKGEPLYAPEDCTIKRVAVQPYKSDPKYRGIEILTKNTNLWIKVFYVIPDKSLLGKTVKKGDIIGTCQAIKEKYGGSMQNHIHVEVRTKQRGDAYLLDPESIVGGSYTPAQIKNEPSVVASTKVVPWTNNGDWNGKFTSDLIDDPNFIGYGAKEFELFYEFEHEGVTNNYRLWQNLGLENRKLFGDNDGEFAPLKQYPIPAGVTLYVPIKDVSTISTAASDVPIENLTFPAAQTSNVASGNTLEYESNITVTKADKGSHYYPKLMKYVTLDPGYIPAYKNRGIDSKSIYPRLRVYAWSRTKQLELDYAWIDVTPYVQAMSISSTFDGSEFTLKLIPSLGRLSDLATRDITGIQQTWLEFDTFDSSIDHKVALGNINREVTWNDLRVEGSTVLGTEYLRNNQIHEKIFQQNDLFFIRFEQLESDTDEELINAEKVGHGWYDLIGLADNVEVMSNAQNTDVTINITGRDLTKGFIEDNTYFNPYSLGHSSSIYGGGQFGKNGRNLEGAFFDISALTSRSVRQSMEFLFHRISSIGYIPDDILDMFSDKTEVSLIRRPKKVGVDTETSEVKQARGIWQLVKFWIDDNIKDLRLVDDSISNPQGSVWDLMKKICQPPFVELFTETLGSTLYVIARRPPFEQVALSKIVNELQKDTRGGADYSLTDGGYTQGVTGPKLTAYQKYLECIEKKQSRLSRPKFNGERVNWEEANKKHQMRELGKIEISSDEEKKYMEQYGVVIVDDKVVNCNEGLKQIQDSTFPLIININEDDVLRDSFRHTQTAFAWYQVNDRGNFAGQNVSLGHIPAIYFDEYAQVFGNRKLEVTSNYSDFRFFETKKKIENSNLYAEQASQLLAFLVETNIHLPFTREGSFTINGDRRIKKGNYIFFRPTREIFYVERVENNISIGENIDRTTTVTVSRGMVIDYIDGKEETLWLRDGNTETRLVSYFNIVDIQKLRDGIYDTVNGGSAVNKFDYKADMLIDTAIMDFFLKKKQFKEHDL